MTSVPLPFPYIPGDVAVADHEFQDRVQQNFDALAAAEGARPVGTQVLQLAVGGTARKVAFAASSLHFAANNISNVLTVTHGLGTTPTVVLCTGADTGDSRFVGFGVKNIGSTTFDVSARDWASSTVTKDLTFYWLAIG